MSVTIPLLLSTAGPQGTGAGGVGFGIYWVTVKKSQTKLIDSGLNKGFQGTTMWCGIEEGTDPDMVGRQILPYIPWPEEGKLEPGNKLDAMTAVARKILMVTAPNEESRERSKKAVGVIAFSPDERMTGASFGVVWDPENRNAAEKEYDRFRFLTRDEFDKVLAGKIKIPQVNTYGLTPQEAHAGKGKVSVPAGGSAPESTWTPPPTTPAVPTQPTGSAATAPAADVGGGLL